MVFCIGRGNISSGIFFLYPNFSSWAKVIVRPWEQADVNLVKPVHNPWCAPVFTCLHVFIPFAHWPCPSLASKRADSWAGLEQSPFYFFLQEINRLLRDVWIPGMCTGCYLCVPIVLQEVTAPLPWCQHQQVSASALSLCQTWPSHLAQPGACVGISFQSLWPVPALTVRVPHWHKFPEGWWDPPGRASYCPSTAGVLLGL